MIIDDEYVTVKEYILNTSKLNWISECDEIFKKIYEFLETNHHNLLRRYKSIVNIYGPLYQKNKLLEEKYELIASMLKYINKTNVMGIIMDRSNMNYTHSSCNLSDDIKEELIDFIIISCGLIYNYYLTMEDVFEIFVNIFRKDIYIHTALEDKVSIGIFLNIILNEFNMCVLKESKTQFLEADLTRRQFIDTIENKINRAIDNAEKILRI